MDPICRLQACMQGFQVAKMEEVAGKIDIFTSAAGNSDFTVEYMEKMKNNAGIGNTGHFNNKIEMDGLEKLKASRWNRSNHRRIDACAQLGME